MVAALPREGPGAIDSKAVTPAQKERIIASQCSPRAGTPVELIGAMPFLASPASRFVIGQTIKLDGGVTSS